MFSMPIVFKIDNAASYLKGLFDTPTDTTSVGYLYGWGDILKVNLEMELLLLLIFPIL